MITFIRDSTKFVQLRNGKYVGHIDKLGVIMTIGKRLVLHKLGAYDKLVEDHKAIYANLVLEGKHNSAKHLRVYDISDANIKDINMLVSSFSYDLLARLYKQHLRNQNYDDAIIIE